MSSLTRAGALAGATLAGLAARDVLQREHAILRNFPIVGHFRYWLESIGPELRQYIVTSNDEERPFSRDQRRWVYASSKSENNYFGFGTDNDIEAADEPRRLQALAVPAAARRRRARRARRRTTRCRRRKVLGGAHGRRARVPAAPRSSTPRR